MTLLIIGIVVSVILASVLIIMGDSGCEWYHALGEFFGYALAFCSAIALVLWMVLAFNYKAAEYKAAIINREYKTEYTRLEVFYASDVIDIIRELDRKRVEINGDILKK
jgi:alcohol dehydrogenase class IV